MKTVYILGAGHCGSTLLNLMLNGHPQIMSLSEVVSINRKTILEEAQDNPSITPFWLNVIQCYEATAGHTFSELNLSLPSALRLITRSAQKNADYLQKNSFLFECILKHANASILVDASKNWQRLYLLRQSEKINLKIIHLVRDGQAVVNAFLNKNRTFYYAFRRWFGPSLMALYLRRRSVQSDWLQIKYEDITLDPEAALQDICAFLKIDFEPEMLSFRKHFYVGIGGNRMRKGNDRKIFLDERWKTQLSRRHLSLFSLFGGWLNRFYGY